MQIADRVTQIRNEEHARLRQAIFRLDSLLREAAAVEEEEIARLTAVTYDSWDRRQVQPTPTTPRRRSVQPLQISWRPLEEALLNRLDRWEELLLPLCQRWSGGQLVEEELRDLAIVMMESRSRIEALLRDFRNQVLFVDPLKEPARALVAAIEACDGVEEGEVVPALLGGIPEVDGAATPKSVGSDEIARNLRSKVIPKQQQPPPSGLRRWLGWGK